MLDQIYDRPPQPRSVAEELDRALDPDVTGTELLPLAVHRSPAVRTAVAARQDCPVGALLSLGYDRSPVVLRALVENPSAPTTLIRQLAESNEGDVRDRALARLKEI